MTTLQDVSFGDADPNYGINNDYTAILTSQEGLPIVVGSSNYWSIENQNNVYTLYIQNYNADGTTDGDAVLINPTVTYDAVYFRAATVLDNGNIVLVWQDVGGACTTQIYAEDGEPLSTAVTPDTVAGGALTGQKFQVVELDNGTYVIATYELVAEDTYGLTAQIYNADGTTAGDAFALVPEAQVSNWQSYDITAVDGGFVVMVNSPGADPDNTQGVIGAVYANDGTELVAEFSANATAAGDQQLQDVVSLADGGYIVTWNVTDYDAGTTSIMSRVFDAAGEATGAEFTAATPSGNYIGTSETVGLSDGSFAVVWAEADDNWEMTTYWAQRFDTDGNPIDGVTELWTGYYADTFEITETENGVLRISYPGYNSTTGTISRAVDTAALYNAPINVAISADTIAEDATVGTVVGELSATDADDDPLTYMLDDDADGLFELVTENGVTNLVLKGSLDFETTQSYEVVVSVTDGEYTSKKTLEINVGDANEAPENIQLSNTTVSEAARAGSVVGTLSATDPEGNPITWSLVTDAGDNNDFFLLKTNSDGTVSVILRSPLDYEGPAGGGIGQYDLVVKATDSGGKSTTQSFEITSTDELMLMAASPTGKNYVSVMENVDKGQKIGFFVDFDDRSTPLSATLVDDADGKFDIKTSVVDGVTRYYLVVNGALDHEAADLHSVTVRATDADGNTQDKTYDIHVLDAAETGDTARGRIKIDAATALAAANGGVNWDKYIDAAYKKVESQLPNGVTFAPDTSDEYLYSYNGDGIISLKGSELAYWWSDPESGEDVHVVGGTINSLAFGERKAGSDEIKLDKTELSITGLDLSNGHDLMDRIYGEANAMAAAWMHGASGNSPAEIEFVKALLASYAQDFVGSKGNDTYTGTIFNDRITGGQGKDVLRGDAGNDKITGGAGVDKLYGGAGEDTFVFLKGDTGKKASADTIYDFKPSQGDVIDLTAWDANSKKAGNQDFKFIGDEKFHGKAGELHFVKTKSDTWIEGDTNGDRKADFVIHLDDAVKLTSAHFDL